MKKFIKVVLICFGIIALLCIVHLVKNTIIISQIKQNFLKTEQSLKDYQVKMENIISGNKTEYYIKGNCSLLILERDENNIHQKVRFYTNYGKTNCYTDNGNEKTVKYNVDFYSGKQELYNFIEELHYSDIPEIVFAFCSIIGSEKYEGKECYKINLGGDKIYIEKDTGLCLKDYNAIREYSFEEIDDSIFVEPNIEEYQDYDKIPKKAYLYNYYSDSEYVFKNKNYKRSEIFAISLKNDGQEVTNAIEKWDISSNKDNSVMAYISYGDITKDDVEKDQFSVSITDEKDKAIYELTIVGNGNIYAYNCNRLFAYYVNCKEISGLEYLDTSEAVTMSGMFWNCGADNIDLRKINTSQVTDMSYMFKNYITDQLDLSNFDIDNLKNAEYMFEGARIDTVYVRDIQVKETFQALSNTINFEIK